MTSTLVHRAFLPGGVLAGPFFPLLIDPDHPENNCVLPADYWPPVLALQWRRAAEDAPEVDRAEEEYERQVKVKYLTGAAVQADRGEFIRLTPAAVAALRRQAGRGPCVLEVRSVQTASGFRNELKQLSRPTPCAISYNYEGVRIQIVDVMTSLLLSDTEIDYVRSGGGGFAIRFPKRPEGGS